MQNIQHKTQISPKNQLLRKKRNQKYKKKHSTSGKINWTKPAHRQERLYFIWRATAVTWWRSLQKREENTEWMREAEHNPKSACAYTCAFLDPPFTLGSADLSP